MRALPAALLALLVLAAGVPGASAREIHGSLVFGTSDYAPGPLRVTFLLIRPDGRAVDAPRLQILVAQRPGERPRVQGSAVLEPVTAPGVSANALGTSRLYVAHVDAATAGRYSLLVRASGSKPLVASAELLVRARSVSLPLGAKAPASSTPTIASSGGRLGAITTHVPPDRALLRYSVAGSLAAHRPFVVAFASPKICRNRTCGPVVDVVDHVRRELASAPVRFIHVEPFVGNDPGRGFNRWAREWRLPTEPFTYLVGSDGRIKGKFEGSLSPGELAAAVRAKLLP